MSVGTIGRISYGRPSLAEQAIKLEEALEKQTEKKVNNIHPFTNFDGFETCKCGGCPVCGMGFIYSDQIRYCFYCGQKLNWCDE